MEKKEFFVTNNRFKWISLLLFLMFVIFIAFLYLKADEITKNPCSICAEQTGENVVCSIGYNQRIFYQNNSIEDRRIGG